MKENKPPIDSVSDLSIIVMGLRLSECLAWLKLNDVENLNVYEIILAYHYEDTSLESQLHQKVKVFKGANNFWERIKSSLDLIKSSYLLLIAADDLIIRLKFSYCSSYDFIAGLYYFKDSSSLVESTTNIIELTKNASKNIIAFWTPPNPGDASFIWGTYRKSFLSYILESSYSLNFEASDWYVLTRVLKQGRSIRDSGNVIHRSPNPKDKYINRVIPQFKSRLETQPFEKSNPVLYCVKKISRLLSKEEFSSISEGMAAQIYFKFIELKRTVPEVLANYTPTELASISISLVEHIYDMELKDIPSYPHEDIS
jgi:hypothetical protein